MNDTSMRKYLSKQPLGVISKLRSRKLASKLVKVFNNLCVKCKGKCLKNPERPFDMYCKGCQKMAIETLRGVK